MSATTYSLSDGSGLPIVGFGTYPLRGVEGERAVSSALQVGYRLIDSAVNYGNEEEVGRAIEGSAVPRDEIVVTTKLPGRDHGYDETLTSLDRSRAALGVERVDLYLIHWPNPSVGRYLDSWRAMIQARDEGLVRSIGVSNFPIEFLSELGSATGVLPAVNQIELHPYFPQDELVGFHEEHGIRTEAWSPLGRKSELLEDPALVQIAEAHGRTVAQIVLRWHLDRGIVPIPKSADPERQRENIALFDFELTDADREVIRGLARPDGRLGGDPHTHEEM